MDIYKTHTQSNLHCQMESRFSAQERMLETLSVCIQDHTEVSVHPLYRSDHWDVQMRLCCYKPPPRDLIFLSSGIKSRQALTELQYSKLRRKTIRNFISVRCSTTAVYTTLSQRKSARLGRYEAAML
ncbi:hypothetical protein MHYP_G00263300 [Metynnis hypsauchen]